MPRRAPRDYYSEEEEIYEAPRRQKRSTARAPAAADDEEYYVRKRGKSKSRIPVAAAPPVEEFERLRVRDRAPSQPQPPVPPPMPLGVRYGPAMDMEGFAFRRGKGDVGGKKGKKGRKSKSAPVSEESESEDDDEEVRVKHVKRPKSKSKTRRREIEEEDEEEEVVYKEKKKGGKKAKGKKEKYVEASETESSSEEEDDEEYAVPVRRNGQHMVAPVSVPDDDDDSEEEIVHRRKKKGKAPVDPEYERATRKASKRGKEETVRYPSVPKMKSRRRDETESETETESESETTSDDSDDDGIVVRKSERRGRSKGKKSKHRKDESSGSPNLREPSMSRKRRQKFIDTGTVSQTLKNDCSLPIEYEMVKPTRAQSPDFPRSKSKKGRRSKDDMFIEPFDPYANWPPVETSSKKKKSKAKAIQPRARSADRDVSRDIGRRMKDARNARDDLEVDLYSRRKAHYPAADFVPPKAGALVAPKSRQRVRGTSMSEMGWPQPAGRKLKYLPEEESSSEESSEDEKATPYLGTKPKHQAPAQKDRLWTEITKDLVVREAIERAGYEYEETDQFYYIFAYLHYVRSTVQTSISFSLPS